MNMIYRIEWIDGNGARSRGMGSDNVVVQKVECDPKMIGAILAAIKDVRFIGRNICNTSSRLIDDKNLAIELSKQYDYEDLDNICNISLEDYLDNINLEEIDGGSPWVIKINSPGKIIYKDDYYDEE